MIRASFFRACLVVTALFVTVHAQAPPRDVPSVPPPTGTAGLAGVVKDLDGSPVRRATVKIAGDMRLDRLTVADDEGKFAFDGLPAGRFTITALKAGYPDIVQLLVQICSPSELLPALIPLISTRGVPAKPGCVCPSIVTG